MDEDEVDIAGASDPGSTEHVGVVVELSLVLLDHRAQLELPLGTVIGGQPDLVAGDPDDVVVLAEHVDHLLDEGIMDLVHVCTASSLVVLVLDVPLWKPGRHSTGRVAVLADPTIDDVDQDSHAFRPRVLHDLFVVVPEPIVPLGEVGFPIGL